MIKGILNKILAKIGYFSEDFVNGKVNKALSHNNYELNIQLKELEWAHIYHDSIRGQAFINELSLNIGRWAGNYSFFYVLNRILRDTKPKKILEHGLGESTKMISAYLKNELLDSKHVIVEHDQGWIDNFLRSNSLSNRSTIVPLKLKEVEFDGFKTVVYDAYEEIAKEQFDLILIDGPFGSDRFSRMNVLSNIRNLRPEDSFIIIMDDVHRKGEQDTFNLIKNILAENQIIFHSNVYDGNKSIGIVVSEEFKFCSSM